MSPIMHICNQISQEHQKQAKNKCNTNLKLGQVGYEDQRKKINFNQRSKEHPLCL